MQDLKQNIVKITSTITKTSGELLKTTKLSLAVSTEEEKLKALYVEIGKKVHEIYAYGGSLGKFFDEKYNEIVAQENTIKEIKYQLEQIKGVKNCSNCGKTVERNAGFCPKCGAKLEIESVEPILSGSPPAGLMPELSPSPDSTPTPVSNPVRKICSVCGKDNESPARFCLYCGRTLN